MVTPARTNRILWLLYAAFILYAGTIPFHFAGGASTFLTRLQHLPLNPLISPETGHRLSITDLVQNILFFVPFGAFGVASAGPSARWTWGRIIWVTVLGTVLSCVVEAAQLTMKDRVASLADVMTNTAGALAGAVAVRWGGALVGLAIDRLKTEGLLEANDIRPLAAASAALAIAFLEPFDVTLELGVLKGHVRMFMQDPWGFGVLRDEGMVVLIACLFAMALASYVMALGERAAGRKAVMLGVPVVCALEAAQFVIASRSPTLWDAAVGSMGVVIGAALWTVSNRVTAPRLWQGLLVLMTVAAVLMQQLSPFQLAPQYRGFSWLPFYGYYTRTTFEALSHAIELALAFFPLGFCIGLAVPSRRQGLLAVILLTLAISGPAEYLQGWIAGRYPDISDVGLSVLGAWIGWRLSRTVS